MFQLSENYWVRYLCFLLPVSLTISLIKIFMSSLDREWMQTTATSKVSLCCIWYVLTWFIVLFEFLAGRRATIVGTRIHWTAYRHRLIFRKLVTMYLSWFFCSNRDSSINDCRLHYLIRPRLLLFSWIMERKWNARMDKVTAFPLFKYTCAIAQRAISWNGLHDQHWFYVFWTDCLCSCALSSNFIFLSFWKEKITIPVHAPPEIRIKKVIIHPPVQSCIHPIS